MMRTRAKQLTFVVRLWREGAADPWRASAQSATTGERVYFAAAADVCDFLIEAMDRSTTSSTSDGETDQSTSSDHSL